MQKSALQYGKVIFQSKVIPLFLPKCSKLHSFYIRYTVFQAPFILYKVYCIPYMEVTVYFLPYMEVTVGKKKKKAKHGEMRWTPKQ